MDTTISKDKVLEAYNNAPDEVRKAFNAEETTGVIQDIQAKYRLHADVAGTLGKNVGYMLLGLLSPTEFFGQMVLGGVDQTIARGVLETLNTKIFIPLSQRMKNPPKAVAEEGEDEPEQVSPPQERAPEPLPAPSLVPPPVPPPAVPAPASAPSIPPSYNLIQPQAAPAPIPQSPILQENPVPAPHARTMATDMDAVTHPERYAAPAEAQGTMPAVPHPWQTSPAQSFQTASVPYTSMPVDSRAVPAPPPVQLPHEWSSSSPEAMPNVPTPQTTPSFPSASAPVRPPLTKEYGMDPYREPIQ